MISPEEKQAVVDLFPFMGENPVVFDVGSNKGGFSDIILEEFDDKCRLHLFEPNEKLLSFTEIKYEYRNNITFHKNGLWKEETRLPFFYFENYNNELSSFFKGGESWSGLPTKEKYVLTRTVDGFIKPSWLIEKIDFLKIDCEGSDIDVLLGCCKSLSEDKIGIIQIEYSEHWERGNHTWKELKEISDKYGYKIYRYIDGNFLEEKSDTPEFDNYFLTKFEIHNYCISGSNANFLLNTVDLPKFDFMRELGSMEGVTAKYMCENMLNPGGRLVVVDPLYDYYVVDDPRYHPEFKNQYQRFLRNTRGLPVELKRAKTEEELPLQHRLRFQFTYIDANHYSPWPYWDGVWSFATTVIGGYILWDDYEWAEETKESIDKFLNEFSGSYELLAKNYQVLIRKTSNQYNELNFDYYK